MPRKLRHLPEPALVEVTCRTIQGRFLLRPCAKLNDRVVGILARAQRRTGMKVCAFVYLSNHCHLLLYPTDVQQLARFMAYVNSNIAREAGRLHAWKERFWGRRYADVVTSHEPEAQEQRLRYLLAQGVKEGLVASPRHWPGASSTKALMQGGRISGEWIDRTAQYRERQRGHANPEGAFRESEVLELTPLPCWQHLTGPQQQCRVRSLVREIEAEAAAQERQPLGRRAILAQHPHERAARSARSPAPRFHAVSNQVRRALEWSYRLFRLEYRQAAQDLRRGRKAEFPPACFVPGSFLPARAPG
jgi:REP element-mobilizing transposase RayT